MLPTHQTVQELLDYDPETGHFHWKKMAHKARTGFLGKRAGCPREAGGYWVLQVAGKMCYQHRLAWFYVHGAWPEETVDHINGDKGDNRIANLRLATRAQNQWNIPSTRSRSGYVGVRLHKPSGLWQAYIHIGGVCKSLGYRSTPAEASALREAASRQAHGEFHYARSRSD